MKLLPAAQVKPNEVLAQPIYSDNGQVLLQAGVTLTERLLSRLNNKGITYIYVEDKRTEDIEVTSPLNPQTRVEAMQTIKEQFQVAAEVPNKNPMFNRDVSPAWNQAFGNVVEKVMEDLQNSEEALSLLSDAFAYDSYIFTHSLNVTMYTLRLAMAHGYNRQELRAIGMGAILHDIGKMQLKPEVLHKTGKLDDHEFEHIKKHPEMGFLMLKDQPNISLLTAHCAYQHHERLNGSGYPRGIAEEAIHPYAKILAVADVFDAVTSNRVYRKAMLPHEGMEILYAGVGELFDDRLVDTFSRIIALYPNGMMVTLTDGREAVVVSQNGEMTSRPNVRVLTDEASRSLDTPYDLNLLENPSILIQASAPVG
ncbi:HD-GYP domain-containing protein (c-di-GMP phosphodiesterase class II) [Salsuginibacillus halophilus]|uniref:HD-GYP domain-containing protein (C-di-GMP phosphodiesterase class II) n=1 Tax=Salsuginibacillus halophilus TaxID=517424 RepID=A0A2P8HDY1_9BACI|nr:HD-GYP domain-containing protein [Salsuginibacillus halophilus]PSL44438.1 HD-GYP domain-containing protein (c-di-GMP phosphodiesterase class II) [Salsuginibacillus halophilus]